MKFFFSVGEPSGDLHGANLIRALQRRGEDWEYVGFGGPRMAQAGCRLEADLTQLAIMWFARALLHLPRFLWLLIRADRMFRDQRPDVVVLIDYPGFNWWVARRAKARGIPVVYYGTPQVWAWASHRVEKMRRLVDHVLCKLPFEAVWFTQRGCRAIYVGHPYFDELVSRTLDASFLKKMRAGRGPLVTILPGSRHQEVASNTEAFLRSAQLIARRVPHVRFACASYNASQAELVRKLAADLGVDLATYVGRTAELIEAADCCLACSGSVSLELLYHTKPSVILYRISRLGFFVQRQFRRVRYITLVNLLTSENPFTARPAECYDPQDPRDAHVLMPEYLTCEDKSGALAAHVVEWLRDESTRTRVVEKLAALRDRVAQGGASERAADYLVSALVAEVAPRTSVTKSASQAA